MIDGPIKETVKTKTNKLKKELVWFVVICWVILVCIGIGITNKDEDKSNIKEDNSIVECNNSLVVVKSIGINDIFNQYFFSVSIESLNGKKNIISTSNLVYSVGDTIWIDYTNKVSWKIHDNSTMSSFFIR